LASTLPRGPISSRRPVPVAPGAKHAEEAITVARRGERILDVGGDEQQDEPCRHEGGTRRAPVAAHPAWCLRVFAGRGEGMRPKNFWGMLAPLSRVTHPVEPVKTTTWS
jgi:hypothetical protein